MGAELLVAGILAWLGTYAVHSTLLLAAAWALTRIVSSSRRFADAAPAVRECLWRVALLAPLLTASVQRGLEVSPSGVVWTFDAASPRDTAAFLAGDTHSPATTVPARLEPQPAPRSRPLVARAATAESIPFVPVFVPLLATFLALPPGAADGEEATAKPPRDVASTASTAATAPAVSPIAAALRPATPAEAEPADASSFPWARAVLALWLLGVAAGLVGWAREWIALHKKLVGRVAIDRGPVARLFAELCERSATPPVRLTSAPALGTPISLGILRSEIVIPPRANAHLSPDELEALFAHELAHVRRGDPLWLVIYRAIQVVFFFQPLNRVARVRLHDEAELLADDWAATQVDSRVSLASCLTEIAGWIVDERRMLPAPAMAARGTRLSLRVRRLLDEQHHPERARRPSGLLLLAGLAVTGVALFGPGVAAEPPRSLELEDALVRAPSAPRPVRIEAPATIEAPEADPIVQETGPAECDDPLEAQDELFASDAEEEEALSTPLLGTTAFVFPTLTLTSVTPSPSRELDHLALELAGLRHEADRRRVSPELRAEIEELERDIASLKTQAEELDVLLEALQQGATVRLGP